MPKARTSKASKPAASGKFTYDDYVKERDSLIKFEQATYDGYEKTILTLSSAFLAFSVSFLGLLQKSGKVPPTPLVAPGVLFWSWMFFASAVFIMLANFLVNAMGLRAAVGDVWNTYDSQSTHAATKWTFLGFSLYFLSGISFLAGVIALIRFCAANLWTL
jgi:hypothetical protein